MISLGFHIRNLRSDIDLRFGGEHLDELYRNFEKGLATASDEGKFSPFDFTVDRLYVGDEFCANRLPKYHRAAGFVEYARRNGIGITLLTPVLSDGQIEESKTLFDTLYALRPSVEITVNDWGLLFFLKERYPEFRLALGRLMNKGFKDPRLDLPESDGDGDGFEADPSILDHCTFDQKKFREKALELGIRRLERDLFPYREFTWENDSESLASTFYFPFGYVTTGRVCRLATFTQPKEKHFMPVKKCAGPCEIRSFLLSSPKTRFPVFQNGNTVFYLYPPKTLGALLACASKKNIRLVHQGFSL